MTAIPAFSRPDAISPACTSRGDIAPDREGRELNHRHGGCSPALTGLENLAQRHRHGAAWLASFDVSTELTPVVAPPRKKSGGVNPVAVALLVYLAAVWGAVVWGFAHV